MKYNKYSRNRVSEAERFGADVLAIWFFPTCPSKNYFEKQALPINYTLLSPLQVT